MLCDPRKHAGTDLFAVVEGEHEVRAAILLQDSR